MLRGKLKAQVEEFVDYFPHFGTPEGAAGRQLEACLMFLNLNGYEPTDHIVFGQRAKRNEDGTYGPTDVNYPIIQINQHRIDFAARQFNPNAPFPQEWEI